MINTGIFFFIRVMSGRKPTKITNFFSVAGQKRKTSDESKESETAEVGCSASSSGTIQWQHSSTDDTDNEEVSNCTQLILNYMF